ncbi:MAG: hypothetical protein ACKO96_37380, partial [Flammeovirgaceae bacterium]
FQPASGQSPSNIVHKNGNDKVLGLFYAAGVSVSRIFIDKSNVPQNVPTPSVPPSINESCILAFTNSSNEPPVGWKYLLVMKRILALLTITVLFSFSTNDDFIAKLSVRLEQFSKLNPDERLCLITNQEKFSVNDTIFFSGFYYQSDLHLIASKRVFSVGLFSSRGTAITKINFSITNGYT